MTAPVHRAHWTDRERQVDVLIVGGGPSGLAASLALRSAGVQVALIDRERSLGGIPRHSRHTGYGLRDLHRVMSGPRYAARYAALAERAGVEIHLTTTATDWSAEGQLITTSPAGVVHWAAKAVLLATGCRERPRSARLVPGDRPAGVLTTGTLQQLADLFHLPIGERAVVVGAEHVSFSAVHTLRAHGVSVAAVVTDFPHHQTYGLLKALTAGWHLDAPAWLPTPLCHAVLRTTSDRHRTVLYTETEVVGIVGKERVAAVELQNLTTRAQWSVECDTVVFTGSWIPDDELARRRPLVMAGPVPRVDQSLRTSRRGAFASGNLVHPAETADIAALGGRRAARSIVRYLHDGTWPDAGVELEPGGPFVWVHPSRWSIADEPPTRGRLLTRTSRFCGPGAIEVVQGGRVLHREHRRGLVPNRSISLPAAALDGLDPAGGPVRLEWQDQQDK
jgi:NADPH-dependent 2,4-dienoyl-CoA reductase/sulfur reductase-like enzyme